MASRRSQAAMEFLLTYGWAILAVVIAISALSYFGVLSMDLFLPEVCNFPPGISCTDTSYHEGVLQLFIRNNLGHPIRIDKIEDISSGCVVRPFNPRLEKGDSLKVVMLCEGFKGDLRVEYTNLETGLTHKDSATSSGGDGSSPDIDTLVGNEPRYCENANNYGLCSVLDDFGDSKGVANLRQLCCAEMSLCCP